MKFIWLSLLMLSVSCSKSTDYDKRKTTEVVEPTGIFADPSGVINDSVQTIGGVVPEGLRVSVHQTNTCTDPSLREGSASDFQNQLSYNIPEGIINIYLKVSSNVTSKCYGPYRNYIVDRTLPTISLDPSISAAATIVPRSYVVRGVVADNRGTVTLQFHRNSACSDSPLFTNSQAAYNAAGVTLDASIIANLAVTQVYAKATDDAGNSICQLLVTLTHVTGTATDANSFFTIEKTLITPALPIQTNLITYSARDVNNNPVSGLGPISFTVTPEVLAAFNTTFTESTTPGDYTSSISLGENYALDLLAGQISFETTRHIGDVVVTDDPFCYQGGRMAWVDHKQSGAGITADPYLICTPAQMKSLADSVIPGDYTSHYKLMTSLNMTSFLSDGTNVFSIGEAIAFGGTFDGADFSITNFKMKESSKGLFSSVNGGEIKNLRLQTNQTGILSPVATGLLINEINTNQDVVLDNISVEGTISLASDLGIFGGVVGRATVSGSSQLNASRIKSTLTISEINTAIAGGVFGQINSATAGRAILSQIDSTQNWTTKSILPPTLPRYAGVIGTALGAILSDIRANFNFTGTQPSDVSRLAAVASDINLTTITRALAQGEVNVNTVQAFGGIAGIITNVSSITNSVSLVNATGTSCSDTCGKVVGITNSGDNDVVGLYTSNQTALEFNIINDVGVSEGSIDVSAQPGYFFNAANAPMNTWNFSTIWIQSPTTLPTLNSSSL